MKECCLLNGVVLNAQKSQFGMRQELSQLFRTGDKLNNMSQ